MIEIFFISKNHAFHNAIAMPALTLSWTAVSSRVEDILLRIQYVHVVIQQLVQSIDAVLTRSSLYKWVGR